MMHKLRLAPGPCRAWCIAIGTRAAPDRRGRNFWPFVTTTGSLIMAAARRTRSRFFTGITFVFCGSVFWHAVEATKVPAPHNEKQRRTIVIFAVQLMNFLISCLSLSSLFQAAQISKAINSAGVSIRPARLHRITTHQIEAGEMEALLGQAHLRA